MILLINVQNLIKLCAFRMRVHWSYPYWRNIWYTLQLFSSLFAHKTKNIYCIGMLSIAIFDIHRWRYLHITFDHIYIYIFLLFHAMAYPLAYFVLFMKQSWQHILSWKPLEIKIKTDQTNRIIWKGRTAAGLTLRSRPGRSDGLDRIRPAGTVLPIRTII